MCNDFFFGSLFLKKVFFMVLSSSHQRDASFCECQGRSSVMQSDIYIRSLVYGVMVCLAILMMVMVVWKDSFQISAVYQPAATSNQKIQPELNVSLAMPTPKPNTTMASPPSLRLLCHSFDGRLGNQMFQVASILGLAWTMNRTAVFVGDFYLDRLLEHSLKWSNQAELEKRCSNAQVIHEENCYRFKYYFTELDPKMDFSLGIYLQSWKYFDKFRAQVKRALVFNQAVVKEAATIVEKIRDRHKKAILIGVHIRRGDFEAEGQKRRGYPMASPGFLKSSFTYFQRLFANCTFVIASENIRWCRENTPPGAQVEYLDVHSPAVDMSVLVSMDHVITTFGTYSWWIGYLNEGITVYMKDFIVPGTHIGGHFTNPDDYIYPGWVPL